MMLLAFALNVGSAPVLSADAAGNGGVLSNEIPGSVGLLGHEPASTRNASYLDIFPLDTSPPGRASTKPLWGYDIALQQQLQTIETLHAERGAYGHGLEEAYRDYGKLHFTAGNHGQAAAIYRQAWHLSRINQGLYSEAQLDHLNLLIEALIELEQWDEVYDLHQLSFLIASRVYPPDDIRYVLAAEFYTRWQWQAINSDLVPDEYGSNFQSVQELSAFYSEVIDKVEHSTLPHMPGLVNLLIGKARTDISIARALVNTRLPQTMLGPGSIVPETECFNDSSPVGGVKRRCRTISLAVRNFDNDPAGFIPFALSRYLKQIEGSILRLQRLGEQHSTELSPEEDLWVAELITTLQHEYQGLLSTARRF